MKLDFILTLEIQYLPEYPICVLVFLRYPILVYNVLRDPLVKRNSPEFANSTRGKIKKSLKPNIDIFLFNGKPSYSPSSIVEFLEKRDAEDLVANQDSDETGQNEEETKQLKTSG